MRHSKEPPDERSHPAGQSLVRLDLMNEFILDTYPLVKRWTEESVSNGRIQRDSAEDSGLHRRDRRQASAAEVDLLGPADRMAPGSYRQIPVRDSGDAPEASPP